MSTAVASRQQDDLARDFDSFCKMLKSDGYLLNRIGMIPTSFGPLWPGKHYVWLDSTKLMQQSRRLTIVEGVCSSSGSNENEARGEHRLPDHLHSFSTSFLLPSLLSLSIFPSNPCQSPWLLRTDCVGHLHTGADLRTPPNAHSVCGSSLRSWLLTPFVAPHSVRGCSDFLTNICHSSQVKWYRNLRRPQPLQTSVKDISKYTRTVTRAPWDIHTPTL